MFKIEGPAIDALAMVRRIRDEHTRQLSNATPDEIIQFHRERAIGLHAELAKDRAARQSRLH